MIGSGVYALSEVSRYTGIAPSALRSWFRPRSSGTGRGPMFQSDYDAADGDFAVSFLNLVDAYVAQYFRLQGVKAARIRRVYRALQEDLNTGHPFARKDLYTDGIDIFRRAGEEVHDAAIVDVLTKPGQRLFPKWQDYLGRFDYVDSTKLAFRWRIATGVVVDPTISFGKPVVRSTGVTTFVLANQYAANRRNVALVADLYGVSEEDVLNAVRFETEAPAKRLAA